MTSNSLVDLQQRMGRLKAENSVDSKKNTKSRTKANQKDSAGDFYVASDVADQKDNTPNIFRALIQLASLDENSAYEQYACTVNSLNDCYGK